MFYSAAQIATARESWDFWKGTGLDDIHAAAWLADEDGETSFNWTAIGDHGEAHGICQWHTPRILDMIKGCKIDVRSAGHEDQLKAANYEYSRGTYKHVKPAFVGASTLWSAVAVLVSRYEQSSQQARDIARRTALGEHWLATFGAKP